MGVSAVRIVGSVAIRSRDRLTALRAAYSALSASRSATTAALSLAASSWNSARSTVSIDSAASTRMSATPRFFSRSRRACRANRRGLNVIVAPRS